MAKKTPAAEPKATKKTAASAKSTKVHETEIVDESDFQAPLGLDSAEPAGLGAEKVFPTDQELEEAAREAQRLVKEDALFRCLHRTPMFRRTLIL